MGPFETHVEVVWLKEERQPPRVLDTDGMTDDDQYKLGNAAIAEPGYLWGIHVTDDPEGLAAVIKSGKKLTATYGGGRGRTAELGPGLYISAVPETWAVRSTGKFDFLKTLTSEQKQKLADAILSSRAMTGDYLASFEKEYVRRDVKNWLKFDEPDMLIGVSGQPYNIAFWKPEFLKSLGIEPAKQPQQVKVKARGKFVDLSDWNSNMSDWRPWLMQGMAGAFIKGGFSGMPQLVIWDAKAIFYVGK